MRYKALFLLFIILAGAASAQIFLGTVDGFVKFAINGSAVSGANVTVNVSGKTGAGSSGDGLSDASGYYIVTNLNADSGDTVNLRANYSNYANETSATVNAFQTVQVNFSVIAVPYAPTLHFLNDTHNNSIIIFNWTSGLDPDGNPTFDRFTIDGVTFNDTDPPTNRTFLSYDTHTWSVVTCNAAGCSSASSDSFEITNEPPPSPILEDEPTTIFNNASLNWTSGGADPEGDPTYFQFKIDSGALQTNVTPPLVVTNLSNGTHIWRVRECDGIECSDFSVDTFIVNNSAPSTPSLSDIVDNFDDSNSFSWISGSDPDNQTVFDEFQFNSSASVINATSPQEVNVSGIIGLITVRVRTCDLLGACSAFDTDEYIHYVCPAPEGV